MQIPLQGPVIHGQPVPGLQDRKGRPLHALVQRGGFIFVDEDGQVLGLFQQAPSTIPGLGVVR